MYDVRIKKKVAKNLKKMPVEVQMLFRALVMDLQTKGPVQPKWKNFSQLGKNQYHCHLGYHHSACWYNENGTIEIEVYYVGSREGAPY